MTYYVAGYVQGYKMKEGGKCWETVEDTEFYSIGLGTDKYMIIDGRLSAENARMIARQWASKCPEIKDIYFQKCISFRQFLEIAPEKMPIGKRK